MRIGVDIGGTFTDVVIQHDDGRLISRKVLSTPPQFADGVLDGIAEASREVDMPEDEFLGAIDHFVHGTTATTNVVLTRTGERVGLLTTEGFGDTYRLARQYRGSEQDPAVVSHPEPLVAQRDIMEITERIDYRGEVVAPIDEGRVRAVVSELAGRGIRSFAICFLWSFRNSVHEQVAERIVREICPDAYVAASYAACPVTGEYERTSTAAITAYAGPALHTYALGLVDELRDRGFDGTFLLMKSDGGPASVDGAVRAAAQTIYSGPAAGVVGAKVLGARCGDPNLITFDMGGTSTDVGIVHDGEFRTTTLQFLDRQALATPMIEISTVGAGGGSIARMGPDHTLKVGPESAGAMPGPACYGRGTDAFTVTDANLLLGLIDRDNFLGGRLRLDVEAAERAAASLAKRLGLDLRELAHGTHRVVNGIMADAIRMRTVYAGLDPRDFVLVSFGGAGGLHCASVARELGIPKVIVPTMASTFSAVGLVGSELTYSFVRSTSVDIDAGGSATADDLELINGVFAGLRADADAALRDDGLLGAQCVHTCSIELSYRRQILDFEVGINSLPLDLDSLHGVVAEFDERYSAIYGPGAAAPENGYSLKNYRLVVRHVGGRTETPMPPTPAEHRPQPVGRRLAMLGEEVTSPAVVEVFAGRDFTPGATMAGPAIIEFDDTSVFVPLDAFVRVDAHGNLCLWT